MYLARDALVVNCGMTDLTTTAPRDRLLTEETREMRPSEQIQKLIDDSIDCGNAALIDAALEFVKAYEAKVDEVVAELRRMAHICSASAESTGSRAFNTAADLVAKKLGVQS